MDFACVHKIEDLQHHKSVKHESHVSGVYAQVVHDILIIVISVYFDETA